MKSEWDEYHRLSESKLEGAKQKIQKANDTNVGRRFSPTRADGEQIKEGVMAARACRDRANQ